MLTGHKYVALVNNYAQNSDRTCQELENITALDLFSYSLRHQQNKFDQIDLKIPKSLKIYSFDNGVTNVFPEPAPTQNSLLSLCFFFSSIFFQIQVDEFNILKRLLLHGWSIYSTSLPYLII